MILLEMRLTVILLLLSLNLLMNIYKENGNHRNLKKRLLSAENILIMFS
jgi:hypothetical protein